MDLQPQPLPEDAAGITSADHLRGCLRDLLSVLALPSLLTGKDPAGLVQVLAEALEHLLDADACCVRAPVGPDRPVLEVLRVQGQRLDPGDAGWSFLRDAEDAGLASESQVRWVKTPIGDLRMVRVTMNYAGRSGLIFLGRRDAAFPDATQAVVIRAAAGQAGHALATATAMEEREQALRVKDEFLAMLGHELRNPLAPIASVVGIMKIRGGGTLSREHQIIERQVKHLTGLVDDLLDIAKVTRGKIELNPRELEVSSVVAHAVEMSRPLMEQRRHELAISVAASGLPVRADPRRLAQVLSNLLINAAKYTPEGGRIEIWARDRAGEVRIGVRDNGVGIDLRLLPRVFDMFYQVQNAQDRSGLGLGLALVKSLVQLHGGRVEAFSAGPGTGSEFVVTLPLAAPAPALSGSPGLMLTQAAAGRCGAERILVVDDNQDAAIALDQLLTLAGHKTQVAHDAAAALLACEHFQPSVALLDIGLPAVDGYQLAQMIRDRMGERCPRLLALTGYGLDADRQLSAQAGFEAHMAKPIEPERLLATIARRTVQAQDEVAELR